MWDLKFIGGILLIVGTSIGGGMLALPVVNAATGFWQSSFFLLLCWIFMTLGALYILEVNLYLPSGNHMISMANATLGIPGLCITWLSYLFLLYILLAAYISGGADVMGALLAPLQIHLHSWQASGLFTIVFGLVVYQGIYHVDLLNRLLMFGKLGIYVLLVFLIAPYVQPQHFRGGDIRFISGTILILITSFGFAIIVPNLRTYFNDDIPTLKKVILIGSLIPLLCYLAWDAVIIGSLPAQGSQGLINLMNSDHTTSELASLLTTTVNNRFISALFHCFTSICMLTAFLGVSLCLISFLSDGLKLEQRGWAGGLLFILTFVPPLVLVLYYPGAYLYALNYAGIFCVILLLILPVLMAITGRHKYKAVFQVPGGIVTQTVMLLLSTVLLVNVVWNLL